MVGPHRLVGIQKRTVQVVGGDGVVRRFLSVGVPCLGMTRRIGQTRWCGLDVPPVP